MSTIQIALGAGVITLPAQIVADALIARLREQGPVVIEPGRIKIGEPFPGGAGIFAGDIRGDDGTVYGLILTDTCFKDMEWGPTDGSDPGAGSDWDGLTNTRALIAKGGHAAAKAIGDVSDDRFTSVSDLYLPAKRELQLMAANLPHLFEKSGWYWTSTQYGSRDAWAVDFENGIVTNWLRLNEFRARAVRRFTY